MNGARAAIRVGATAMLIAVLGWAGFRFVSKGVSSGAGYPVWALFRDATGLVEKSRVQIAGLVVGDIAGRSLQGNQARVAVRIKPDVKLWSNAVIYKRSASLLGEYYLEIDPGTPSSPDPLTGEARPNYPLEGCVDRTHDPDCNQVRNVVEAITTSDIMAQMNETLPVLRDILHDVHKLTQGPLQDLTREVQQGVRANSLAAEQLLRHLDLIARDLRSVTNPQGQVYDDLRQTMENVRIVSESIRDLVGSGRGDDGTAGGKIKQNLDQVTMALDKINRSLDSVSHITDRVDQGQGTIGRLINDDTIARNAEDISEDTAGFVRSITRLQTLVGMRGEYNILGNDFKTYVSLKLQPRPDKYYLLELVDDPRGSISYQHTLQSTTVGNGAPNAADTLNVDTYTRSHAFRFTFQFAKRLAWRGIGLTGRLGIKESTGGGGFDFDVFKQRFQISTDLFGFGQSKYPRLKFTGGIEVFKHFWVLGGVDDVINAHTDTFGPTYNGVPLVTCGPATPSSWCKGGRDYFVGAQLTFNDEDLRALLAIGGSAVAGAATKR